MANYIQKLFEMEENNHKYLIIAGNQHLLNFKGIPEKIFDEYPDMKEESALIIAQESNDTIDVDEEEKEIMLRFQEVFGERGTNPADYVYLFDDWEEKSEAQLLTDKFETLIQNPQSDTNDVADVFFEIVKLGIENLDGDPNTSRSLFNLIPEY